MKQTKVLTYNLDFALSNKYLEVIIKSLEPKISNEKVEVSFYKTKKTNKTSTFSFNILGSKDFMINSKYLFDSAKSKL